MREDLEQKPDFAIPGPEIRRFYPVAASLAEREVRRTAEHLLNGANRRLDRDRARVQGYYDGMAAQLRKRMVRAATPAAKEKESGRLEAIELDRAAKLDDLLRKYALRASLSVAGLLVLWLPVHEMKVRLIRKKSEREQIFHWNHVLHTLESLLCEKCGQAAAPLHLCDRMHCLCKDCLAACPRCAHVRCLICRPQCSCGG